MKITKAKLMRLIQESIGSLSEDKLTSAQSKEMDTDKDGDIDGKDLGSLRKDEAIFQIVKEEYAKIKGTLYEETKPHEDDRHPVDTPDDRIRLEEGDETSRMITSLEQIGKEVQDANKSSSDPDTISRLDRIDQMITNLWDQMHNLLPNVNEETKPHETDRHPADTPEDRIRK